jgi:hypothetical protein
MNGVHRNSFARALGVPAFLILSGLLSSANGQTAQAAAPQAKSTPLLGNSDFGEAATIAPSFAGFFYSSPESDTLVVAVADMGEAERARAAVLSILARKRNSMPYKVLTVRKVNYSLIELTRWQALVEKELEALPQVTAVGVNEGSNTITVGVRRNSDDSPVRSVMRSSGVPQNAYELAIGFADCPKEHGCALEPNVVTDDTARATSWRNRPGERSLQEIAVNHPAFAGFAYDSSGSSTLVVGVKGAENIAKTLRGAIEVLRRRHVIAEGAPVVPRLARYSFLELDAWRDSVEARLFTLPIVTMLDLDELNYRLTVGIRPGASTAAVVAIMRDARIPTDAYGFETVGMARREEPLIFVPSPP